MPEWATGSATGKLLCACILNIGNSTPLDRPTPHAFESAYALRLLLQVQVGATQVSAVGSRMIVVVVVVGSKIAEYSLSE